MILVIDIGNTNIVLAGFDGERLMFSSRIATEKGRLEDQYAIDMRDVFRLYGVEPSDISGGIVGSVVPILTEPLRRAAQRITGSAFTTLSTSSDTGLEIAIDHPAETGADLIASAVAVKSRYPLPAVIIDMGTATKLTVLDEKGVFRGGVIAPGAKISLEALVSRTSQLPGISFEAPAHVVGTNTADCMKSGLVFGSAAMLDGMIDRMSSEVSPRTVVATGGIAVDIVEHCRHDISYDPALVLEGLRIIYERNRENGR